MMSITAARQLSTEHVTRENEARWGGYIQIAARDIAYVILQSDVGIYKDGTSNMTIW